MAWIFSDLRPVDALWGSLSLCFCLAFFANRVRRKLPSVVEKSAAYSLFQDLIRYGKTKKSPKKRGWLRVLDVPKRWFWHFYATSVVWNGFLLAVTLNASLQDQPQPACVSGIIDVLTGSPVPQGQAPRLCGVLLLLLLWLHSVRRLLECLLLSVFSAGVINLPQYGLGLVYYVALGPTALCVDRLAAGSGSRLTWTHLASMAMFVCASLLQHHCAVLLARLRTAKSGSVQTLSHVLPRGGAFELLSCPHYFAELLIYVSLCLLCGGLSLTWWLLLLFVFFNQALAAELCHEHYVSTYRGYPRQRRAFIPFLL